MSSQYMTCIFVRPSDIICTGLRRAHCVRDHKLNSPRHLAIFTIANAMSIRLVTSSYKTCSLRHGSHRPTLVAALLIVHITMEQHELVRIERMPNNPSSKRKLKLENLVGSHLFRMRASINTPNEYTCFILHSTHRGQDIRGTRGRYRCIRLAISAIDILALLSLPLIAQIFPKSRHALLRLAAALRSKKGGIYNPSLLSVSSQQRLGGGATINHTD
mmetsp:Transcript_666/g.1554  ORF Transcript_666/g.1554 Transcript_666/m.1554 type:complete len:217 (+) Transcript_666:429-1079(+)